MGNAIMARYLRPEQLRATRAHFGFLADAVRGSKGELELSLRQDRFTVYFQGNSLTTVRFRGPDTYRVEFHPKFLDKAVAKEFGMQIPERGYAFKDCDPKTVRRLLRREHVERLKRAIRRVNYGEEITYEQFVLADTPPSEDFLIIDRQVTDSTLKGRRMDLLALRRMPDGPYRLVVLEVKLGKNPELAGAVIDQLALYTDHLNRRDVLAEYADCYETAYAQKHGLGLYPREMPDRVDIDREAAEGVIVVIGYAAQARGHLNSLRSAPGGSRLKIVELSHDLYRQGRS